MSDTTRVQMLGYFVIVLILVFVATMAFTVDGSDKPANTDLSDMDKKITSELSEVDEKILTEMFRGRVYLDESGNPDRMNITYGCPSMYGIGEDHPLFGYFVRWRQLYDAHEALVKEGSEYAHLFAQLEQQLISELGYYATQRDGRIRAHALFSSSGLYELITARAGRSELSNLPEGAQNDRWGSSTQPYARGVDANNLQSTRESVIPFHYCAGMRDQNGNGITISGGQQDPYVRAHTSLMSTNASYRETFNNVILEFQKRARALDPMDFAGTSALTRDLREALIKNGVADAIEQAVTGGTIAAMKHTH